MAVIEQPTQRLGHGRRVRAGPAGVQGTFPVSQHAQQLCLPLPVSVRRPCFRRGFRPALCLFCLHESQVTSSIPAPNPPYAQMFFPSSKTSGPT